MKQRPRIYYTESQKKLMWDHWQKGDSLQHRRETRMASVPNSEYRLSQRTDGGPFAILQQLDEFDFAPDAAYGSQITVVIFQPSNALPMRSSDRKLREKTTVTDPGKRVSQ
ncbi:hypothetical protein [Pseudomonas sp. LB3P25]